MADVVLRSKKHAEQVQKIVAIAVKKYGQTPQFDGSIPNKKTSVRCSGVGPFLFRMLRPDGSTA